MKKIIVLAFVAMLFTAKSMALDARDFVGFTLNYSYQDVRTDVPLIQSAWGNADKCLAHGFNAGFVYQQPIYRWFVLVTGFQYQFTMASRDVNDLRAFGLPGLGEVNFYNHNLIVPFKLGFSFMFLGLCSFSIYAGPSLDFLVSTQMNYYCNGSNNLTNDLVNGVKTATIDGDITSNRSVQNKQMDWFDVPVGIGFMTSFSSFGIRFEYEWGMLDRWKGGGQFMSDQLTAGIVILF